MADRPTLNHVSVHTPDRVMRCRAAPRHARFVAVLAATGALLPALASAQPGTTLFYDDLDGNLNDFTIVASGGNASLSSQTFNQGRSMRLRWGTVSVFTDPIAAAVPGAVLDVWIRRGDDSFSENPEAGEDLLIEFRDANGSWIEIDSYAGGGTPGEIYTPTYPLPPAALHANLSIRFTLTGGSGSDFDYWHIDDVRVTEVAGPGGSLGIGSCDDFESGLGGWTVTAAGGDAGISAATASSPSNSLFTRWGPVTVASQAIDLSAGTIVDLDLWVQRGSDAFSENPENGENLVVEYYSAGGVWNALETFAGGGAQGEVFTRSYTLPANAMHAGFRLRFRQTGGDGADYDYWHVDDVCLVASLPVRYSFEEEAWTGAGGEIVDSNGVGPDGTAVGGVANDATDPAVPTNPGTCRYGEFDGIDDYVEFPDGPAFDIDTELTVAAWINMRSLPSELHTIVSKDWNYEFHINAAGQVYWWWNDASGTARSFTTSSSIALNRWYHIAITYASGAQVIYVDGMPAATASYTGQLRLNDLPFYVGTDWNFISRAFHGLIDEVVVDRRAYSQAQIQALRDATHPCAVASAQFTLNHDTFGIHCLPETITVDVIDSVAGTPLNNYNAAVRLDTQSGSGSWSLVAGGGTLTDATPGDGIAVYDWPLGESQAQFQLYYPDGNPVIDVDAYQVTDPGIRDTDAEGLLTFSPDGFTVTANPLSNPPGTIVPFATAQTAGVSFDVSITAYGQTADDPVCGVIESYTGNRNLKFWSEYVNPGTGFLNVDVDGVPAATVEGAAVDQVVAFVNGQGQVTLKYKDAGRIRLAMKDDTTTDVDLPTGIRGSTAGFVSRPADFLLSDIEDADGEANPAAADAGGEVFIAAGEDFSVTVTAVDAEGDPTPNFGRESPAASVELEPILVAPVGGQSEAIVATTGFAAFSGGQATGTDFSWPEVGIVQLRPSVADGDYLASGDVVGTDSVNVGRFVPDHFSLVPNTPVLRTQCEPGQFTYAGQPFDYQTAPVITATARSLGGAPTQNYTGAFFRMTTGTLANRTYAAAGGTLDDAGVPSDATDPAVIDETGGVASIVFDPDDDTVLSLLRVAPEAPFSAGITLAIDVLDADGVAAAELDVNGMLVPANPFVFGAGAGIAFTAGDEIRYGRMRFVNAVGSELVDLPLPLVVQHFVDAATGYAVNPDDQCTTGVTLSFAGFTGDLQAGETCVLDAGSPGESGIGCAAAAPAGLVFAQPPAAGDFNLHLAAPGAGNSGSVIVGSDVPAWLRFDWDAAAPGDENPTGIAAFGLYGGKGSHIYTRELY